MKTVRGVKHIQTEVINSTLLSLVHRSCLLNNAIFISRLMSCCISDRLCLRATVAIRSALLPISRILKSVNFIYCVYDLVILNFDAIQVEL